MAEEANSKGKSLGNLKLGWRVNQSGDPRYWVENSSPKPGEQSDSDLVIISAPDMAHHTIIVAQSGSGKSFLLGRLIEELLPATSARCLILDSNGDFRKIHKVRNKPWMELERDPNWRDKDLPTERTYDEAKREWEKVAKVIRVMRQEDKIIPTRPLEPYEHLAFSWAKVDPDIIVEDLEAIDRNHVYVCHELYSSIWKSISLNANNSEELTNLMKKHAAKIDEIINNYKPLLKETIMKELNIEKLRKDLKKINSLDELVLHIFKIIDTYIDRFRKYENMENMRDAKEYFGYVGISIVDMLDIRKIAETYRDISGEVKRFYLNKARRFEEVILNNNSFDNNVIFNKGNSIEVIDIPSIPEDIRYIALNAIIREVWLKAKKEWEEAQNFYGMVYGGEISEKEDERVPIFIVMDEAHNYSPAGEQKTTQNVIREQFRTIAAEGRKYGLFLILVSQRPDKLDPIVISECENKAVMKLGSEAILKITTQILGMEDIPPRQLGRCLEFGRGRALISGAWAPNGAEILYGAARRTEEGGKNLDKDHWAVRLERNQGATAIQTE